MNVSSSSLLAHAPGAKRRRWPSLVFAVLLLSTGLWAGMAKQFPGEHADAAAYRARAPGQPLVEGFVSYEGVAAAASRLRAQKLEPTRRTLASPPDRRYPPHRLDTLSVRDYSMLGASGKLTLEFFNDRLYEVGFEPTDPKTFGKTLERADPQLKRDHNGRAERIDGDRRIATNVDLAASDVGRSLQTRPYVLWQELRLVRQREQWDQQFGALPQRAD